MSNNFTKAWARWVPLFSFGGSRNYWTQRYRLGGDSGVGSEGIAAHYKAGVLNDFVATQRIESVMELGCGDGRQLELASYPSYLGIDVSPEAIEQCRRRFSGDPSKRFDVLADYRGEPADLTLSLDVIYHLVEDATYHEHLRSLFSAGKRFVVVYSSDVLISGRNFRHVRHRAVSEDIARLHPEFERMSDVEKALPAPVAFNRNIPTVFLVYRRKAA